MSKFAAVILAAGGSERFGKPKQLVKWRGKHLVTHVADVALVAELDPVIVVVGCEAEAVRSALADRPVDVLMNWHWEKGLSTSVQTGLSGVPVDREGAIFLQCDQPLITADLLRQEVDRAVETGAAIVHPVHNGQQRTPVLFRRRLFPALADVKGDEGGRALIERHADDAVTIEVDEADRLTDIDTPADYERLKEYASDEQDDGLLRQIRHLIIDMDGVLWKGNRPFPGLQELFDFLRRREIDFILATNNSSRLPTQYAEKLRGFGVEVDEDHVLTSALAAAAYLHDIAEPGSRMFAIGQDGLRQALTDQGFGLVDENADYVVVGWDRAVTWDKLAQAGLEIQGGARFIGTNPDKSYPLEEGLVPGTGAQLVAIEATVGVSPTIVGKPEPWMYRAAMERMGGDRESTAMLGDRLETDIVGGIRTGIVTVFVESGISSREDLASSPYAPDLIYKDIEEVVSVWERQLR